MCLVTVKVIANEAQYNAIIIRSSQSQSYVDQCNEADYVDNDLSLSQFIDNSINYLTNDTKLIFLPGNYSLESNLLVENIHSLSMSAWPISSSKTVITCGHNARFEFRNIGIVTVSGLEFIECFENHVVSVGYFQLENIRISQSRFEGNKVDLGAVIYNAIGSDTVIFNSTFVNNSVAEHCNNDCCLAGGIVYVSKSQGSTVKLYHSKMLE